MVFYKEIAETVVARFPGSLLEETNDLQTTYQIIHSDKLLISIDKIGYTYFFSSHHKNHTWSGFIEGSLEAISDLILRDLAEVDQIVFNRQGKRIRKRPVRLNEHTVCPKCGTTGTIKRYFFGDPNQGTFAQRLARDRVVLGRSRRPNDPEAICTHCDWKGSTEIFRFGGKET
jgi:hypothetical protein